MASKRTAAPDATPKVRPKKAAPDPLMTPSASAPQAKAPVAATQAVEAKPSPTPGLTPELQETILGYVAEGRSVRWIAEQPGMPGATTVWRWLAANETFAAAYARAKEIGLEAAADELLEIADDARQDTYIDSMGNERTDTEVIGRSKLRIETRKWLLERLAAKKYSATTNVKHSGNVGVAIEMDEEQAKRVAKQILEGTGGA